MIEAKLVGGKWQAVINGKTVKRAKKEHMDYVIRKAMKESNDAAPVQESRFSINERFQFVGDMVTMLAKGDQASVVVTGPGGLGKSHTVTAALEKLGMIDLTTLDDLEEGEVVQIENSYRVVKGYSTPKGLYRTLFENREGVVVFDDCDSVLKDPVSLNLLKAALDSYDRRVISWRSESMMGDDLPQSFEFKGRVVFISNLASSQLDQAIVSRSMSVDLSMTTKQKVERMRFLLAQPTFMEDISMKVKDDAMELIEKLQDNVKELSLRTLIQVTKIRNSAGANWANLAEYTICG